MRTTFYAMANRFSRGKGADRAIMKLRIHARVQRTHRNTFSELRAHQQSKGGNVEQSRAGNPQKRKAASVLGAIVEETR